VEHHVQRRTLFQVRGQLLGDLGHQVLADARFEERRDLPEIFVAGGITALAALKSSAMLLAGKRPHRQSLTQRRRFHFSTSQFCEKGCVFESW
jgi:hypothetical protein